MIMKIGINNASALWMYASLQSNGMCDMAREREIASLGTHRNML